MGDPPDDHPPPPESPLRRALALKKAALESRAKPSGGGKVRGERAAAARSTSKSKPWLGR